MVLVIGKIWDSVYIWTYQCTSLLRPYMDPITPLPKNWAWKNLIVAGLGGGVERQFCVESPPVKIFIFLKCNTNNHSFIVETCTIEKVCRTFFQILFYSFCILQSLNKFSTFKKLLYLSTALVRSSGFIQWFPNTSCNNCKIEKLRKLFETLLQG